MKSIVIMIEILARVFESTSTLLKASLLVMLFIGCPFLGLFLFSTKVRSKLTNWVNNL